MEGVWKGEEEGWRGAWGRLHWHQPHCCCQQEGGRGEKRVRERVKGGEGALRGPWVRVLLGGR